MHNNFEFIVAAQANFYMSSSGFWLSAFAVAKGKKMTR